MGTDNNNEEKLSPSVPFFGKWLDPKTDRDWM